MTEYEAIMEAAELGIEADSLCKCLRIKRPQGLKGCSLIDHLCTNHGYHIAVENRADLRRIARDYLKVRKREVRG